MTIGVLPSELISARVGMVIGALVVVTLGVSVEVIADTSISVVPAAAIGFGLTFRGACAEIVLAGLAIIDVSTRIGFEVNASVWVVGMTASEFASP